MTWYIGAFEKVGDELMKRLPTTGVDEDFVRYLWSVSNDYPVFGVSFEVTSENVDRAQHHVAEKIDLNAYEYYLFDEDD